MMKWLTIVSLLIQLALQIFRYLERQQLLQEGEEKALKELEAAANELVSRARNARATISHHPDDILSDPDNDAASSRSKPQDDPGSGV